MLDPRKSLAPHAVRLGALVAAVLIAPALAQTDDDNTRAVRLLDEPLAAPTAVPAPAAPAAPTSPLAPLLAPPPATTSTLPPLVAPPPPLAAPPLPPLVAPIPALVPPPPVAVPSPAANPAATAAAPKSGSSPYQTMSLPRVEVKAPPTPAEIRTLNSGIKVANPSGVSIEILPGPDFTIGSLVSFRVTTKKEGYLILVDVDAAGKLTQIYPVPGSLAGAPATRRNTNQVRPGRPFQIPNPADVFARFEFVAAEPVGTAMVVAILSDRPVQTVDLPDIPPSMTGRADALAFLTKFANDLRIPGEGGGRLQEARWSFDAKFYAIR